MLAVRVSRESGKEVTSVHVLLPFAFKVLCTRLIVSMLRGSDYVGHPNESLAR